MTTESISTKPAMFEVYDDWADLYDRTVGSDYGRGQFDFLKRVLLPHLPVRARILDLCCGTGQLFRPLIDLGYRVTGLDSSAEMLARASQNAPEAECVHDDARTFCRPNHFDAAISTSASLNHIPTIDDLQQIFRSIAVSLADNGMFVFDLNHPAQLTKWWRGEACEGDIDDGWAWMITPYYDADVRQGKFRLTVFQSAKDRDTPRRSISIFKRPVYACLRRDRFVGLRLKALQSFERFEPTWKRTEVDFPIFGHDLTDVRDALIQAGFSDVNTETIGGGQEIDANHSAHFICRKGDR
ncbi:MAG: methyltransferase domain-containing protein [Planctomycetota bacterium]